MTFMAICVSFVVLAVADVRSAGHKARRNLLIRLMFAAGSFTRHCFGRSCNQLPSSYTLG
jgi:hypothetical protein